MKNGSSTRIVAVALLCFVGFALNGCFQTNAAQQTGAALQANQPLSNAGVNLGTGSAPIGGGTPVSAAPQLPAIPPLPQPNPLRPSTVAVGPEPLVIPNNMADTPVLNTSSFGKLAPADGK